MKRLLWSALAVLLAGLLVAGCGGDDEEPSPGDQPAGAAEGKPISIGFQQSWSSLPVFVGQEQGFFEKHGVSEVKMVPFTQLPAMTTAISRGQVDAGFQTTQLLVTFNKESRGAKFKFFAPGQTFALYWVARKGSNIPPATAEDWKSTVRAWRGKTIGLPALGGILEFVTRYLAEQAGLDPDKDFTMIASGVGPATLAALKEGEVDVVTGDAFSGVQIAAAGAGEIVLNMQEGQGSDIFRGVIAGSYFAPEDRIDENRELYAGFNAAIEEAIRFIQDPANRAAVEQITVEHVKVSPELAEALYETVDSFAEADISEQTLATTLNAFVETGALTAPVPEPADLRADVGEG